MSLLNYLVVDMLPYTLTQLNDFSKKRNAIDYFKAQITALYKSGNVPELSIPKSLENNIEVIQPYAYILTHLINANALSKNLCERLHTHFFVLKDENSPMYAISMVGPVRVINQLNETLKVIEKLKPLQTDIVEELLDYLKKEKNLKNFRGNTSSKQGDKTQNFGSPIDLRSPSLHQASPPSHLAEQKPTSFPK